MSTVLEARSENFADRNPLIPVVLGLISLGTRLDAVLAAHADAADNGSAPRDGHPWDDAILGLIALRRRILGHLEALCPAPPVPEDVDPPVPTARRPREVLR